jgi:hypothetical protein
MHSDQVIILCFMVYVLVLLLLRQRARGRRLTFIREYQRGVRFIGGQGAEVLLPGSYWFNTNKAPS